MKRYGNPLEVEEYFADGSVSQSYLKNLIKGIDHLGQDEKTMYYEEKGHFIIGSAVDVWITQGVGEYNQQYYTASEKKPSDTMMSMVRMIFDYSMLDEEPTGELLADIEDAVILESLNHHKYQARWKEETRLAAILRDGHEYFEELKLAHGKQILSPNDSTLVHSIVMSVESGKYTGSYLRDSPTVDVYFQVPIYFEYEGIPCKALLDILRVDKEFKTLEPIDLKTMGGFTAEFPWAVRSRRYDFQAAFYTEAVRSLTIGYGRCEPLKTFVEGYQIKMFKFIVETTHSKSDKLTGEFAVYTGKPLCYRLSNKQLILGKHGRPAAVTFATPTKVETVQAFEISHKAIHGFEYALTLHTWHLINGFQEDRHVAESDGVILID
jgi:hypothetical protein